MFNNAFRLVDELKIKIEQLLKASELNSLDSQSREIIKLVYKHVDSFEETAKNTLQSDLEKAISSEVRKLRGIVAHIGSLEFTDSEDEDEEEEDFELDVEGLKQRFDSFNHQLKMEEQRCSDEKEDEDSVTSNMIGACDVYDQLKRRVISEGVIYGVTSLVGMPGIGKTTLAKKLFYDPMISQRFDHRVWIRVGKQYQVKDIPRCIVAEIDPDALPGVDDEEALHEHLNTILKSERYLIVIEDSSPLSGILYFDTFSMN